MAEEQTGEAAPQAKAKPKLGALLENKVVLLGVIVILQAVTALAVTKFFIAPRLIAAAGPAAEAGAAGGHGEGEAKEEEKEGELVGLNEMIVTLQGDPAKPHYARANVSVEIADPKLAKTIEERRAQLRDVVLSVLSSKTNTDLLTPEGKEAVREEIARRLNEKLPAGALLNVYFSDLMIQ